MEVLFMKTRISRKKTVLLALSLCLSLTFPVAVQAESILVQASRSGASYFINDWTARATASYLGSTEILDYGFNDTLINEDVAYAYSNGSRHAAKIVNANGAKYGSWEWANYTSYLEVQHAGDTVYYYSVQY